MEKRIPWDIIAKNLKNRATLTEKIQLESWLEEEANSILFSEIQNVYSITSDIPPVFYPDKEKAWQRINRQTRETDLNSGLQLDLFKYFAAAGILLLICLAFLWVYQSNKREFLQQFSEVVAPPGQKTMVILPDSSYVWLNSGSSLKYSGNFNHKDREVILEGEAFFDVKKDKSKKFSVQAGILTVLVEGTSFNVKNYASDIFQEVTVMEGRVNLSDKTKELKQLTSGQQAVLKKTTQKIIFLNVDPELIGSWKENELKFDNKSFAEVVKYLERWYGISIIIDPVLSEKYFYTFKIKTESLKEILEKINLITPINYEINGKEVTISSVK